MKNTLILVIFSLALLSCANEDVFDSSLNLPPLISIVQERYYGFYGSIQQATGLISHIDETKSYVNTFWIDGPDIGTKLAIINSIPDKKVIIHVQAELFNNVTLKPRYARLWKDLSQKIAPYQNIIAAFYVFDEPYWRAQNYNMAMVQMKSQLETVSNLIHQDYPSKPIGVIEAYPMINDQLQLPQGFDWVGFDCYGPFDACGDDVNGYKPIPEYLNILKSKMTQSQKLILIPQGYITDPSLVTDEKQNDLVSYAQQYLNIAESDPSVVGYFPFIYISGATHAGTRELPIVKSNIERIMGEFSSY